MPTHSGPHGSILEYQRRPGQSDNSAREEALARHYANRSASVGSVEAGAQHGPRTPGGLTPLSDREVPERVAEVLLREFDARLVELAKLLNRLTSVRERLMGAQSGPPPTDPNETNGRPASAPSGYLPLLSRRLSGLEAILLAQAAEIEALEVGL